MESTFTVYPDWVHIIVDGVAFQIIPEENIIRICPGEGRTLCVRDGTESLHCLSELKIEVSPRLEDPDEGPWIIEGEAAAELNRRFEQALKGGTGPFDISDLPKKKLDD